MAHRPTLFKDKQQAHNHFKQRHREGVCESSDIDDIESCDCCGSWTVSKAIDYYGGAIVGPWVLDDGDTLFDRVCINCNRLSEIEARNLAGI